MCKGDDEVQSGYGAGEVEYLERERMEMDKENKWEHMELEKTKTYEKIELERERDKVRFGRIIEESRIMSTDTSLVNNHANEWFTNQKRRSTSAKAVVDSSVYRLFMNFSILFVLDYILSCVGLVVCYIDRMIYMHSCVWI